MKLYYLFLESLARIEELLSCMVRLEADEKVHILKKNRADEFRQQWLDKQEVLRTLKIADRTLFNLRKENKLPARMIGKKMYFHISDVEKLMLDRT